VTQCHRRISIRIGQVRLQAPQILQIIVAGNAFGQILHLFRTAPVPVFTMAISEGKIQSLTVAVRRRVLPGFIRGAEQQIDAILNQPGKILPKSKLQAQLDELKIQVKQVAQSN
jgi:hypothetical protein